MYSGIEYAATSELYRMIYVDMNYAVRYEDMAVLEHDNLWLLFVGV